MSRAILNILGRSFYRSPVLVSRSFRGTVIFCLTRLSCRLIQGSDLRTMLQGLFLGWWLTLNRHRNAEQQRRTQAGGTLTACNPITSTHAAHTQTNTHLDSPSRTVRSTNCSFKMSLGSAPRNTDERLTLANNPRLFQFQRDSSGSPGWGRDITHDSATCHE